MSKQEDFIKALAPIARNEYLSRSKWVLPSVCIAQAALESGWNLKAKTLFGIKGNGLTATTSEYYNGNYETIKASFQAYPSVSAAVVGYYDLITRHARYSGAVNNPDYKSTVQAIKKGGYATDPNYVSKVVSIIEKYSLTQYDNRNASTQPTPSKQAASPAKAGSLLLCDGVMGTATTKRTQAFFGTVQDGVISGQTKACIAICPGITTMKQGRNGSLMVKALQNWLGVSADGKLGPNTIRAWQARMGTVQDGKISKPSNLIRAWQTYLNNH